MQITESILGKSGHTNLILYNLFSKMIFPVVDVLISINCELNLFATPSNPKEIILIFNCAAYSRTFWWYVRIFVTFSLLLFGIKPITIGGILGKGI